MRRQIEARKDLNSRPLAHRTPFPFSFLLDSFCSQLSLKMKHYFQSWISFNQINPQTASPMNLAHALQLVINTHFISNVSRLKRYISHRHPYLDKEVVTSNLALPHLDNSYFLALSSITSMSSPRFCTRSLCGRAPVQSRVTLTFRPSDNSLFMSSPKAFMMNADGRDDDLLNILRTRIIFFRKVHVEKLLASVVSDENGGHSSVLRVPCLQWEEAICQQKLTHSWVWGGRNDVSWMCLFFFSGSKNVFVLWPAEKLHRWSINLYIFRIY